VSDGSGALFSCPDKARKKAGTDSTTAIRLLGRVGGTPKLKKYSKKSRY
jgi:hypothetical protein